MLQRQGELFDRLQKKITKSVKPLNEGFETNNAVQKYTALQTQLTQQNQNVLRRLDKTTNPLLGKNVSLNDGAAMGYVTAQGVWKPYNPTTAETIPGTHGCPKAFVKAKVSDQDVLNADTPGYTFTTSNFPPLFVGTAMQEGSGACGAAGQNVYVSHLLDAPKTGYVGCYNNTDKSSGDGSKAMTDLGSMTFNECLTSALNNGYTFFGVSQDSNNAGGTPLQCRVANDLATAQKYGSPDSSTPVLLWESGTTNNTDGGGSGGSNSCSVTDEGLLVVRDGSGTQILFQTDNAPKECVGGGKMRNLSATYGGNCDKGDAVETGNATAAVISTFNSLTSPSTFSFLINGDNIGGNPAEGCSKKSWDATYQCGNQSKVQHIGDARGKYAKFDCEAEAAKCTFSFILNNNGSACLCRGENANNQLWCAPTATISDKLVANTKYAAKNGKTGANRLRTNQTLFSGEWIGSNNGSLRLIMQSDGNLCLYGYTAVKTCVSQTQSNNKTTVNVGATPDINAVYEITNAGDAKRDSLGKMGYIDQNDVLHPYGKDALEYGDKYTIYQNMNSMGNDLATISPVVDASACQAECNKRGATECAGFSFEGNAQLCYLKNSGMYPATTSTLTAQNGVTTGVRLPQVKGQTKSGTIKMSAEKYDAYVKGDTVNSTSKANTYNPFYSAINSMTPEFDKVNQDLNKMGMRLGKGTDAMGSQIDNNQKTFASNQARMLKSIQSYKDKYSGEQQQQPLEGMTNMRDLQSLRGMEDDSELIVTHENMRYIYWMLVAMGLITACLVVSRK